MTYEWCVYEFWLIRCKYYMETWRYVLTYNRSTFWLLDRGTFWLSIAVRFGERYVLTVNHLHALIIMLVQAAKCSLKIKWKTNKHNFVFLMQYVYTLYMQVAEIIRVQIHSWIVRGGTIVWGGKRKEGNCST